MNTAVMLGVCLVGWLVFFVVVGMILEWLEPDYVEPRRAGPGGSHPFAATPGEHGCSTALPESWSPPAVPYQHDA